MTPTANFCLRFTTGLAATLAAYDLAGHVVFALRPAWGNPWHDAMVIAFLLYGMAFAKVYATVQRHQPEMNAWVLLGSKGVKLLLSVMALILYWAVREATTVQFALDLMSAYAVTIVYETWFIVRRPAGVALTERQPLQSNES